MSTSPQRRLDYSLWIAWITGAAFIVPVLLVAAYYTTNADFMTWLWSEQGPLEISHVLIPLLAMGAGLSTLAARGRWFAARRAGLGLLAAAMCGLALMCGVIAGEEASWGQHFLGWSTPESWNELNDQHETNLHNIGSWADQKPHDRRTGRHPVRHRPAGARPSHRDSIAERLAGRSAAAQRAPGHPRCGSGSPAGERSQVAGEPGMVRTAAPQ